MTGDLPEVLVVCTRHAGRPVAARVVLKPHGARRIAARSAGTEPGDSTTSTGVTVLVEQGIDVSCVRPRSATDDVLRRSDVVIMVGRTSDHAVEPSQQHHDWDVADLSGQDLDGVRSIFDNIEQRVLLFLDDLAAR